MVNRSQYQQLKMSPEEYQARIANAQNTVANTMGWLNLGFNATTGILGAILSGTHKAYDEGDQPGATDTKTAIRERLAELGLKNEKDLKKLKETNIFTYSEAEGVDLFKELGILRGVDDTEADYDIPQETIDRRKFNKAREAFEKTKNYENAKALDEAVKALDSPQLKAVYNQRLAGEVKKVLAQKQAS